MKKWIFCILWIAVFQIAVAQVGDGGTPVSFTFNEAQKTDLNISFDNINLPIPDVERLVAEDQATANEGNPPRIGVSLLVNANEKTNGQWITLPNGKLWLLQISSKGAKSMAVTFDDFYLAPGSKMFFYNANKKQVLGAFTSQHNRENGYFATEQIEGESIFIEYFEPNTVTEKSRFHIESVGYFYKELSDLQMYKDDPTPTRVGESQPCHVDINCTPVGDEWQEEKKGISHISFKAGGDWYLCTGSLINNVAQDGTPYYLTAYHCGADDATPEEYNSWIFKFKYEAPPEQASGNGTTMTTSPTGTKSITGCTKLSEGNIHGGSDFQLLLLSSTPTPVFNPVYNGWDRNEPISTTGVAIHHPAGDIKKISTCEAILPSGSNMVSGSVMAANSTWTVRWASNANGYGVTEGGSSGSPLFNPNGMIVGTLTGGGSSCAMPTNRDIFGRFSYHWDKNGATPSAQLKPWLDPDNSTTILDPYNPFPFEVPNIQVYNYNPKNVTFGQYTNVSYFLQNSGTASIIGTSSISVSCNDPKVQIVNLVESCGALISDASPILINNGFKIYAAEDIETGHVVEVTLTVTYDQTQWTDVMTFTAIGSGITYDCDAPTGLTVTNDQPITLSWDATPNVSQYNIYRDDVQIATNISETTYVDQDAPTGNVCYYLKSVCSTGAESAKSMPVCITNSAVSELENSIKLYPNPVNDIVTIEGEKITNVSIYNLTGQKMVEKSADNVQQLSISTQHFQDGIYILKITLQNNVNLTKRVVIRH
ncbi:MAG: T9SS type A sorting domain-containing protein [Bacteroidales bacterium]|nr:T9SS type A sorting domain-containing protein [Bacteroidales bacterium]